MIISNMDQPDRSKKKTLKKIKSSVFSRGISLAKLSLETSGNLASHGIKSFFASEHEKESLWQDFLKNQAGSITTELGNLKGSLMKAGQLLSMYGEHFLPVEANKLLKQLQSQSPPVDFIEIKRIIESEFTQSQINQLEIESNPLGAASLGQVHKAKIKGTTQLIALKVQYPGIKQAIDSDLKALKTIFSSLKFLPKNFLSDHIFSEVKTMLVQETDYALELKTTDEYGQLLANDNRFIVPKTYPEFSTSQILATSFERGVSPDDPLIQNLPQEIRNKLAYNFLDLYFKELFQWGIVQTDPHFGNYKIRLNSDGQHQIVLLDFGAAKKYPQEFLSVYTEMISCSMKNDIQGLEAAATRLQFLQESDSAELKNIFIDFCLATVEPFTAGVYNWKKSDLPQRLTKKAFNIIQSFSVRPPPSEVIFLDRKTGGVFVFLSALGAEFDARPLLEKYIS